MINIQLLVSTDEKFIKTLKNLDDHQLKKFHETITELVKPIEEYITEENINTKNISPKLDKLSDRRFILSLIEEACKYIEYYIPQQLQSGDIATDTWFKNSMRQASAALREKKKWILTPMKDTYDNLISEMISTLILIVNGNWDALERIDTENISRPNFFRLLPFYLLSFLKQFL